VGSGGRALAGKTAGVPGERARTIFGGSSKVLSNLPRQIHNSQNGGLTEASGPRAGAGGMSGLTRDGAPADATGIRRPEGRRRGGSSPPVAP